MNYFNRSKWWAIAFIALLIMNVASLAAVWLLKDNHHENRRGPGGDVADFMARELGFDSLQKQHLFQLRAEHRQQVMGLRVKTREAKDALFALLKEPSVTDSMIEKAAVASSLNDQQVDILTFRHLQKIRALCTPAQKDKFDGLIHEVLRAMGPMQPPPPGTEAHPPSPPEGREPPPPPHQ